MKGEPLFKKAPSSLDSSPGCFLHLPGPGGTTTQVITFSTLLKDQMLDL